MQKTILIIEDDESNRRILEMAVRGPTVRVLTALNGEEGVVMAERENPDLIFLDVNMPKLSGLDVLRRIRVQAGLAKVPVVVISAKAAEQDRKNALEVGATTFITKPFRVKSIQEALEKYLTR